MYMYMYTYACVHFFRVDPKPNPLIKGALCA